MTEPTHEELERKRYELIIRLRNGKHYRDSVVLNKYINMLIRQRDPYVIIDQLCESLDEQSKLMENLIMNNLQRNITNEI